MGNADGKYDPAQDAIRSRLENKSGSYDPTQDVIRQRVENGNSPDGNTVQTRTAENAGVSPVISKEDAGDELDRKAATMGVDRRIAHFRDQLAKIKLESEEERKKREKK